MPEWTLEEANARLAAQGYPPIRRLPADEAALDAWKRVVDGKREWDAQGKLTDTTRLAISQFCHCYKCPTYPRGEEAVYCLTGKTDYWVNPVNCKCPSCEVYQVGGMHGVDYFCITGVPAKKLQPMGGAVGVAGAFLAKEIDKGNPGKRVAERLMAPPSLIGRTQDDIEVPEKVPGW